MKDTLTDTSALFDQAGSEEMEDKYLTFFCDDQLFALSINHVVQIVGMQQITPMPQSQDYLKGLINLRGSIVPVVDTRLRLQKPEAAYDERTCIIICIIGDLTSGLIVDAVDEVIHIDKGGVTPTPASASDSANKYVTGVAVLDEKTILLMDVQQLLDSEELGGMMS